MNDCIVCGSRNKFKLIYNDTLLQCPTCSFITANMEITPEILNATYTENYFKGEEYPDYVRDKLILQTNFKKRLQYIFKYIDKSTINNIIEIGCAYGFFSQVVSEQLQGVKYIGYDIVPEAIDYGLQLNQNLILGDYLKCKIKDKVTDIFMWDVIEHLPNPEKFIEKAASELKIGGRLYITTGDIGRLVPRIQQAKWRMIHPPSHLHYFSRKTLSVLLEKNGFKIITVHYPPVYRSIRLIYYSLFMLKKKYPKIIEKVYDLIPRNLNVPLNTYDIMFVIAIKEKSIPVI